MKKLIFIFILALTSCSRFEASLNQIKKSNPNDICCGLSDQDVENDSITIEQKIFPESLRVDGAVGPSNYIQSDLYPAIYHRAKTFKIGLNVDAGVNTIDEPLRTNLKVFAVKPGSDYDITKPTVSAKVLEGYSVVIEVNLSEPKDIIVLSDQLFRSTLYKPGAYTETMISPIREIVQTTSNTPIELPPTCRREISTNNINFPQSGGTTEIQVMTTCDWTVGYDSPKSWLSASTTSPLMNGNGKVKVKVDPNSGPQRKVIIYVADQKINVTQKEGSGLSVTVTNSASFEVGATSGMLASLFGESIGPSSTRVANGTSTSLEGVRVWIDNKLADLIFVSPNQINLRIPDGIGIGKKILTIEKSGQVFTQTDIDILNILPGIYSAAQNGVGIAAGQFSNLKTGDNMTSLYNRNETGQIIAVSVPQSDESTTVLSLYGTGFNESNYPVITMVDSMGKRLSAKVAWFGRPQRTDGFKEFFFQLNVEVPKGLSSGIVKVEIESLNKNSNAVEFKLQ